MTALAESANDKPPLDTDKKSNRPAPATTPATTKPKDGPFAAMQKSKPKKSTNGNGHKTSSTTYPGSNWGSMPKTKAPAKKKTAIRHPTAKSNVTPIARTKTTSTKKPKDAPIAEPTRKDVLDRLMSFEQSYLGLRNEAAALSSVVAPVFAFGGGGYGVRHGEKDPWTLLGNLIDSATNFELDLKRFGAALRK